MAGAKGDAGRVLVVGGSTEYTGAPFLAAMGALRAGAELAHVVCAPAAAPAIKGYSPDVIVHPLLPSADGRMDTATLESLVARSDAVVVGPGLSRERPALDAALWIAHTALRLEKAVVLDGDALFLAATDRRLLADAPPSGVLVLTPNRRELARLVSFWSGNKTSPDTVARPSDIHACLSRTAIVAKGPADRILSDCGADQPPIIVDTPSSRKRCGGQGDILAGVAAALMVQAGHAESSSKSGSAPPRPPSETLAHTLSTACRIVRTAAHTAEASAGVGLLASDVLSCVSAAVSSVVNG